MAKREINPGTVVYVDSNQSRREDRFAVIIDLDYWHSAVAFEDIIFPSIEKYYEESRCQVFRILGRRSFRKWWQCNDPEAVEPDEWAIWHYDFEHDRRICPVDLRPFVEFSKLEAGRAAECMWGNSSEYMDTVIRDAEVIYRYLDGERFSPSERYLHTEDKLLRLLGKAVPL